MVTCFLDLWLVTYPIMENDRKYFKVLCGVAGQRLGGARHGQVRQGNWLVGARQG